MRKPQVLDGSKFVRDWEWWDKYLFDYYTSRHLPDCDIFSGLSSSALLTGAKAKQAGAKYVCDRGSTHIRFQDRILREEYDRVGIAFAGIDPRIVEREEAEYALCDLVTVPSDFVHRSFMVEGMAASRIEVVPYGVDVQGFRPVAEPERSTFDVLFVGALSVRKGVGYLLEAFEKLEHANKRLHLVGGLTAELRERVRNFASRRDDVHLFGHVRQGELPFHMSRAHVLVMPSVEEGLALVQAMACGCPVIATVNSGAENLFVHNVEGFIVPPRDPDAIAGYLQKLANDRDLRDRMAAAALAKVKTLGGWDAYGERIYRVFCALAR